MEISKSDWKLFRKKLPDWQEAYMEKLCGEYAALLTDSSINASDRFWDLEKRLREDKRNPGVLLEVRKSTVFFDIASLVGYKVITPDDLSEFSEELQAAVRLILSRYEE